MAAEGPIDFASLAAALLERAGTLVPAWLPNGVERNGRWYIGDFDGSPGESANVNLDTGQWYDNAGSDEDRGGDLISLYARIRGLNNGQAARELMRDLGWMPVQAPARTATRQAVPPWGADEAPAPPHAPRDEPPSAAEAGAPRSTRSRWRALVPVPQHAPAPQFRFGFKDKKRDVYVELDAVTTWEYRFEDQLFGYVARFERVASDGALVKDTVPLTWCENITDDRGMQRWHWKSWEAPRPLYVPATLLSGDPANVPVVLVEGEKCALAGHQLLGHEFDFVSWPGGCKAWAMARWGWLIGRTVYLWPDCDAQPERLTRAEREAGVDPKSKPLQPEHKQPGMAAMVHIGALLAAEFGCTVFLCAIPEPGSVPDGWDIADAIAQGWDAARVRAFVRGAREFVPPTAEARSRASAELSTPSSAGAGTDEAASLAWRSRLLESEKGGVKACRENVVLALDGVELPDGRGRVAGIAEVAGVVAYNEFTNDVMKLKPAPWGSPAGVWDEVDELLMGEWLVREHWLPSMPRGTLEEAVRMVAYRHRYHPVREYLSGLQWDGTKRLATWLRRAVLEEDEWDDAAPLQRYLARAGTWFLQGMCARALQPGVKFDYMLILEGAQGLRKSTLLATLAGDFFADTGLVLGEKDSYQQLQGRWLYEFPELDAFSKADVTKIKAFIASVSDYFRASFDKRARDYPRQLVFGGSTNEDHYLTDPTGNRRFWPVRVTRTIDIDWVAANRDQLFAEAVQRVQRGARMFPTPEEERELFRPQQQLRAVENAIESAIGTWLHDDDNGVLVSEISLVKLLSKIGIGIEKLGPGRFHEKQAAAALRRLGWTEGRSSEEGRPRVYRRPRAQDQAPNGAASSSTAPRQGPMDEDSDGCPF
ncbi:MAG: VapE domain-containing protein [Pseudomonadota bacterium]